MVNSVTPTGSVKGWHSSVSRLSVMILFSRDDSLENLNDLRYSNGSTRTTLQQICYPNLLACFQSIV